MSGWLDYPRIVPHAKNYAVGRQGYRPVWFVVHATDTAYQDNYPVNLGKYWQRNPVQVSTHFCVSDTMTYQYVNLGDTAYQARNPANLRGVGVEIVGKASWTRSEWLAHKLMLRRAARLCAEVTLECGFKTEPALLSPAALRARNSGLTSHKDLTTAFNGTHTDPGAGFPWDYFLIELRNALKPAKQEQQIRIAQQTVADAHPGADVEDTMAVSDADWKGLVLKVDRLNKQCDRLDDIIAGKGAAYGGSNLQQQLSGLATKLGEAITKLDRLSSGSTAPANKTP